MALKKTKFTDGDAKRLLAEFQKGVLYQDFDPYLQGKVRTDDGLKYTLRLYTTKWKRFDFYLSLSDDLRMNPVVCDLALRIILEEITQKWPAFQRFDPTWAKIAKTESTSTDMSLFVPEQLIEKIVRMMCSIPRETLTTLVELSRRDNLDFSQIPEYIQQNEDALLLLVSFRIRKVNRRNKVKTGTLFNQLPEHLRCREEFVFMALLGNWKVVNLMNRRMKNIFYLGYLASCLSKGISYHGAQTYKGAKAFSYYPAMLSLLAGQIPSVIMYATRELRENHSMIQHNITSPLVLTDIGGNVFNIEKWFESPDLIQTVYQIHPSLQDCDLCVSTETDDFSLKGNPAYFYRGAVLKGKDVPIMIVYS